jgi:hypothetical protein
MKRLFSFVVIFGVICGFAMANVTVDEEAFGKSLGGWKKKPKNTAEYSLSGSIYRTYRPETSRTPEGGIYISIRIDHVRGWLSSDDHAVLEITVGPKGTIDSAKSSIAIQGKSITSDVIIGVGQAGQAVTQVDQAVQVGTDLVADLTAKLLREKIVEPGRVSFPAALRHNYNLLYQALLVNGVSVVGDEAMESSVSANGGGMVSEADGTRPSEGGQDKPTEDAASSPQEESNAETETNPPAAVPVVEHEKLEVTPYITPKQDLFDGSI